VEIVAGDPADVDIETEDGNVDVVVAPEVSAAFLLSADDGGIRVDASGIHNLEQSRGRVYGEIGDAQGELRVAGGDGRISLEVGDGGA
jgi:hypothetical protein